ncbi:MAG: hypothetical protein IT385_24500 [Deltaproteobacteria bacterium]|nr:hypothetical protein [Deltaproteobacteria bacterium]
MEPTATNTKLLMTDPDGNELLKAALPSGPTLPRHIDAALFGADLMPCDSVLVRYEVVALRRRRRTLSGMGDFRQLRLVQRRWA